MGEVDKASVWHKVLRGALAIPGARVDRDTFLRSALSKHLPAEVVDVAIAKNPAAAGISKDLIERLADSSIGWHRTGVTAASAAAGLPGGWWMAATVPGDLTQFFWHIVQILQKLAYLYSWPQLVNQDEELDDETLHLFTVFVGVMFGAAGAGSLLTQISRMMEKEVAKRLPQQALTKWGIYNLAKQVAKWIGVKLTKDAFGRALSKAVPVIGSAISGGITWITFSRMTRRLSAHLRTLTPHVGV